MSEANGNKLPKGWTATTLGQVQLDLASGINPARMPDTKFELYSVPSHATGVPEILNGGDVGSNKQVIEPKTVLLCKINPRINRVWVVGNHSKHVKIASTEWIPFFPLIEIESRYLAYFLMQNSIRDFLAANASGVGGSLMRVRAATLRDLEFLLAPKAEQKRIADALDELLSDLDAGVAALERAQAKLRHYRAAVLKAAVEGSLTAKWRKQHPDTDPASELLKGILVERRKRWEQGQLRKYGDAGRQPPANWKAKYKEPVAPDRSELPNLPQGWLWSSLGQCFDVKVGATPSRQRPDFWSAGIGGVPWVSSGEVQFCRIKSTSESISRAGLENSSTCLNPKGSVILGMIGEGRTRGQVAILDIDACNNQNCAAIWVPKTPIPPEFVYSWLWSRYKETRAASSGNNQLALNKQRVEEMPIPLPPLAEQQAIVEAVEDQLSVIDHLEADFAAKVKAAQGLRQSILRHAFTGKLVPQNPNDEPASELLKRIATERAERERQLAAEKRKAKQKKPKANAQRGK